MNPERQSKLVSFLNIGLFTVGFMSVAHQQYLGRLKSDFKRCTQEYSVGDRSVLSYATTCEDNLFHRGSKFRYGPFDQSDLLPDAVVIPAEMNECQGTYTHDMYKQVGPTCYLTCIAAAISDLSERQDGPAIDPLYLSDMVALEGALLIPEHVESLADVNTSQTELDRVDHIDLGNGLSFDIEPHLLEAVPSLDRNSPEELSAYIAFLLEGDNHRLVYSSRIDENKFHAVLVLDHRVDDETGIPYLLVAEPNGGGVERWRDNADYVKDTWTTLAQPDEFLTRIDITPHTVALTSGLTRITLVDEGK